MSVTTRLIVGKIRTSSPKYPSEAGYVQSVNTQLRDLEAAIMSIFDQFVGASNQIMLDALQPTFDKSQEYCPIDTGALRASGYILATGSDKNPRVEVGYGKGGNPSYTVFVHENLSFFHSPPTRSKFLQAAMLEDLTSLSERLRVSYENFMGSSR